MRLCRFRIAAHPPRLGLVTGDQVADLAPLGWTSLGAVLARPDGIAQLRSVDAAALPRHPLDDVTLLAPVDQQEVWAAGVTYLRSKAARMEESDFSASAYDRVYAAPRPELFFKATAERVVAPHTPVGIRRDARWSVPEPELALVLDARGGVAGYTVGNDMSSRDIEGENLLYLPQAKIYDRSCALGPWIELGPDEAQAREWTIRLEIRRAGGVSFAGETVVGQLKRRFAELAEHLFRCQRFPAGAVLLTGTGIVPPDSFTLQAGDEIDIEISGIGRLHNPVMVV